MPGFKNPRTIMVQGTTSDAGKSTLVAGLCRVLARQQQSVVPFKPQNMALNSAVTLDGGEIGRAQAVQAQASYLEPHIDMNPILIKPNSDIGAQIIVHGKPVNDMDAQVYHRYKNVAMNAVLESFDRLNKAFKFVIVEGAGSPAEINLRDGDIANMGFAEAIDCPVILIADIDKGGVFAHLVGTLELLSPSEQDRVVGFVINRFRGDITLLEPGLDWLEGKTGKPVLGVLPFLKNFYLESEDAINSSQINHSNKKIKIIAPVLPRISNHTDFDALRAHPDIDFEFVAIERTPPPADLIILPGSKNTRVDLVALKNNRWQLYLDRHLRYGGKVLGICGGFQMLGSKVVDALGKESEAGQTSGFNFIPMYTELAEQKTLKQQHGQLSILPSKEPVPIQGYEIHYGQSRLNEELTSCIQYHDGSTDGFMSDDGQVFGCYLHGLLDTPDSLNAILSWVNDQIDFQRIDIKEIQENEIDRLADCLEHHLNWQKVNKALDLPLFQPHASQER